MRCRDVVAGLAAYQDQALAGGEARAVAEHLLACRECRRAHERVKAGAALAAHLPRALEGAPSWEELAPLLDAPPAPGRLAALAARMRGMRLSLFLAPALAVSALLMAPEASTREAPATQAAALSPLEAGALAAHQGRLLDARVSGRAEANRWIADRLGLEGALAPGAGVAVLEGVASLRGADGAAVAARVDGAPVTLALAPRAAADPAVPGGPAHQKLERRREGDFEIVSWEGPGRSYVLISALPAGQGRACVLCHGDRPREPVAPAL
jgi:hypothetical protein